MSIRSIFVSLSLLALASTATADLTPYEDYEVSDSVWTVSTIKVHPNIGDAYLEGIKKTWVASNEVAKKLGQIESYSIFRSDMPESGDFNLLLIVKFANTSDLAPNKERYDAFMEEWGESRSEEVTSYSQKNYPAMREITGQYQIREITLK